MVAGLTLELASLTSQDSYLTCKPECTFFRKALCRYTNFAIGQITQTIGSGSGSPLIRASSEGQTTLTLQRTADLMGPSYVRTRLPALNVTRFTVTQGILAKSVIGTDPLINDGNAANSYTSAALDQYIEYPAFANEATDGYCYCDAVGFYMIKEATASIGGHQVDRLLSEQQYLEWVSEHPDEKVLRYSIGMGSDAERTARAYEDQVIYSPLQFWYTKHSSQYLPVIALQGHDVVFEFKGRSADALWGGRPGGAQESVPQGDITLINDAIAACSHDLVYDGVFLDRSERMMTARMMIEVIATEHGHYSQNLQGAGQATLSHNSLPFNHPTRGLVIALRRRSRVDTSFITTAAVRASALFPYHNRPGQSKTPIVWNDFSGGVTNSAERHSAIDSIQMTLNNHERFGVKSNVGHYYSEVHAAQKFSGNTRDTHAVYYVFGMNGEGQPTGTLNFSAIDNVGVQITRRRNALSSYMPSTALTTGFDRATVEYEAVEIIYHSLHTNVHKYVSGMFGQAFAN